MMYYKLFFLTLLPLSLFSYSTVKIWDKQKDVGRNESPPIGFTIKSGGGTPPQILEQYKKVLSLWWYEKIFKQPLAVIKKALNPSGTFIDGRSQLNPVTGYKEMCNLLYDFGEEFDGAPLSWLEPPSVQNDYVEFRFRIDFSKKRQGFAYSFVVQLPKLGKNTCIPEANYIQIFSV